VVVLTHPAYPSKPLVSRGVEVIAAGFAVVWFLFQGRPYDIGRFYRPDGTWTGYYVDILEPVAWEGGRSPRFHPIVDLALDVWIDPDGAYTVLDEDEFEAFVRDGSLTDQQERHARAVLTHVLRDVENGSFPPEDVRHSSYRPV
jgi:predicted RNA-binding protein associated with RNAse of E/G family